MKLFDKMSLMMHWSWLRVVFKREQRRLGSSAAGAQPVKRFPTVTHSQLGVDI
jgi:hypothetical protein